MHTLLIEDDLTATFLTKRLFHREAVPGALTTFDSPVAALAFIRAQVAAHAPPNVILLDLDMPVLSGWDVLAALELLHEHLRDHCLVYVLTSSLSTSDMARAQTYPLVTGFIHKPLDCHELQAIQARVRAKQVT
ncbi:MAG: response regulator [Hymenobacter sp.]|nr:MAG: response regulator [Hymenobacter sp.]